MKALLRRHGSVNYTRKTAALLLAIAEGLERDANDGRTHDPIERDLRDNAAELRQIVDHMQQQWKRYDEQKLFGEAQ